MNIELISKSKDELKQTFLVKKASPAYVNSLRRAIVSYVPTLAIEEVEFHKNSSALYDEILAHRLGLIPLLTDLETYELPSECSCGGEGCARCQVSVKLSKKGPCTVYAKDLKISDPAVKPVYPSMPIVKLLESQELVFEAIAVLGIGKEHSKWSPGLAFYKGVPEISIGVCEDPDSVVAKCPRKVLKVSSGKLSVDKKRLLDCDLCQACSEECESVKVKGSTVDFVFTVESWGQLSVKQILENASSFLAGLGHDFSKSI